MPPFLPAARIGLSLALALAVGGAQANAADQDVAAELPASLDEQPILVSVDRLQVPIIEAGDMGGRLKLELVLEGTSAEALPLLRRDLPMLRDKLLSAALEHARLHVSPYAAVDAHRLSAALDAAVKDPSLKRVLIVEVSAVPA